MAGRQTERRKSRCNSVSPIPKRKLAHQIYLRARYFSSRGIKTAELVENGSQPNECKAAAQGKGVTFRQRTEAVMLKFISAVIAAAAFAGVLTLLSATSTRL